MSDSATTWTAAHQAHQASLSITSSQSLLKLMSIESVMPCNHLILCCPLPLLPSIFSNESAFHIRWPKHWSFNFSISPSNEYSGLISIRIDLFNLLAVQGTLKSSPTPQFKSIHSLALSFLYGPTLTSIYDDWKNRYTYIWNLKEKDTKELISKPVRDSTDTEGKIMVTKRERGLRGGIT